MNVAYFGSASRRLFGIYEPPPAERSTPRGVVLCPAWGSEYLMSHRSLRSLASMLVARGLHVFRFDYYGTGDSAGDMSLATLAGWESDILSAISELKEISRVDHVGVVGVRLGADLAANVAVKHADQIHELVLWDPIVSGSSYLQELNQRQRSKTSANVRVRNSAADWTQFMNAWGFSITQTIQDELNAMDLASVASQLPPRTLIATTEQHAATLALRERVNSTRANVRFEHIESASAWREQGNLGAAAVPVALLQSVTNWLSI